MESDEQPQIKSFVIISLPPPDNPSQGKTITAFTLSSEPSSPPTQQPQTLTLDQTPTQTRLNPQIRSLSLNFRFSFKLPRRLMLVLGVALLALALYRHGFFPRVVEELRRTKDDDDEKPQSFLFPLFPKLGVRGNLGDRELKLGRSIGFGSRNSVAQFGDVIGTKSTKKVLSSSATVDRSAIFPVRGNVNPDGLYYTYILVGDPPRPYYLDMDTGSDLTWIQCDAPCRSCAKGPNPLYKPSMGNILPYKDSLCTEIQRNQRGGYCKTCEQCDYEIQYADSSSSMGVLAKDKLRLMMANGSLTNINVVFGCGYDQQGLLLNSLVKTDGILGLSRAKVSLPFQLAKNGIIKNVVGHCLTVNADGGGYMFLGDDYVPNWGMSWIPMLFSPSTDFYNSAMTKIIYGSSALDVAGQVVFDSGSSYTYFTKEAYSQLISSLEEVITLGLVQDLSDPSFPVCWKSEMPFRSVAEIKHIFKTITLQFGSKWWIIPTKFQIPPEGYLSISSKGNVCLGILDGSKVHDGSTTILGDISLRGHLVVYDNENNRIGFTNSDCAKPRRFTSPPLFE